MREVRIQRWLFRAPKTDVKIDGFYFLTNSADHSEMLHSVILHLNLHCIIIYYLMGNHPSKEL